MKKTVVALFIYLAVCLPMIAQENSISKAKGSTDQNQVGQYTMPDEIQKKLSRFFETLISKNIENGFTELLINSPVNQRQDQVQKLIFETKRANKLYGELKTYEIVNSELVTPSLVRVRYLGYHDFFPMRWIFTFYKSPSQNWIVTNIKFDDNSENLFKSE